VLDDEGQRAEAGAFRGVGSGVEAGDGFLDGREAAVVGGVDRYPGVLPGGEVGPHGVFLDHGGEGGGEVGGLAQEGGDGCVGFEAPGTVELAEGGDAAEAGHDAVAEPAVGIGELEQLDGHAQARGVDRVAELAQGLGVEAGAVARQGVVVDLGEGDQVDGHAGSGRRIGRT
jgi:hypothetical protein